MTFPASTTHNPIEIFDNGVLAWGLVACGFAQVSKLFIELIQNRRWRPSVLIETGGMPSSHSALVTGTTAGIGWELGFSHPAFALAVTMAFVVMYDASGIRREAGLIASKVNLLPKNIWENLDSSELKENLGHSRLEVVVGSLIGPTVALPGLVFIGSPLHLIQSITLTPG
ncbi:divergent PAP2 family protein [Prochlorococcus sp. MIT 1341]|uniref:divergent PAP2 family protein n=1 Tax=Prochlorococcus sp. MIT 1341 TaxID=3096221 RepID=UPI002A7637A1|nr:divergent PAP2 family protein [Prochlorococcus sp. MIT 1341]